MRTETINTRDLEYFTALVRFKNFSKVAQHFKVTQPTISAALQRLERYYGVQLIARDQSHRELTVTLAGEQLDAHAQKIIQQLTLAREELQRSDVTPIRFGLPPILGNFYFPRVAASLVEANIMPHLTTIEAGSADLLARLKSGAVDMALLGASGPLRDAELAITPLQTSPFVIITRPDDPLVAQKAVAFSQLRSRAFVTLNEGFVHNRALHWFSENSGIDPSIVYRTGDVTLLKQMVAQGVGIGFLTALAVTPADQLGTVALTDPGQPTFHIALTVRKDRIMTPTMQKLATIISK